VLGRLEAVVALLLHDLDSERLRATQQAAAAAAAAAAATPEPELNPSGEDGELAAAAMNAATNGHLAELRLLLERGAVVDAVMPPTGMQDTIYNLTTLYTADIQGHYVPVYNRATAFHLACVNNHLDCAELLAKSGCDLK
jgi:hypothetical protein